MESLSAPECEKSASSTHALAQVPNGMSWDMKKKVMYYNDTPNQTCTAYATDDEGVPIQ